MLIWPDSIDFTFVTPNLSFCFTKMDDSGMGSQSVFVNGHGTHLQNTGAQNRSTGPSSRHGSTSGSISETFYLPEPLEESEENTEDLIVEYQEQLRQLNACIDRVESSEICPRAITSHPHVMRVNGYGTPTKRVADLKEPKRMSIQPVSRDINNSHLPHYTAAATRINGTEEFNGVSDYESGDLTERSDEPSYGESTHAQGRPGDSETNKQSVLSESPSLDQLAER